MKIGLLWKLVLLPLLVIGCSQLDVPGVPFVSAPTLTPTRPPLTSTPTATGTLIPTPTPTPTPLPAEQLQIAHTARDIGDGEVAVRAYQQVLAELDLNSVQRTQATLGLAQSYLVDEDYTAAIALLESFLADLASPEIRADAPEIAVVGGHLLLADALQGAGEIVTATGHYSAVLVLEPLLAPYAYQWLGDAYYARRDFDAAAQAYAAAVTEAETVNRRVWMLEKLAVARAGQGDGVAALEAYDVILAVAQNPQYRARIMYQAADTALAFGEAEAAYQRMLDLITDYPSASQAHDALVILVNAGVPVDEFRRGMVNYHARAYGPAVQAFYRVIRDDPNHVGAPHYYAGLSFLGAGSLDLALNEFELLIETHPGDPYVPDAWLGKARVLIAQERVQEALGAYQNGLALYPDQVEIPDPIWQIMRALNNAAQFSEAADLLLEAANRYPNDERAPEARFQAGLSRYRAADLAGAHSAWQALTAWYPYDQQAQAAWYWLGKTHLNAGETVSATQALSSAISLGPWDFYGLQAADLLQGNVPFQAHPLNSCDGSETRQQAETWLADWLGLDADGAVGELSPELAEDPRLRRGTLLLRLGRFDEGRTELESLRIATAGDPLTQYRLALAFRDVGLYRSSIIAASTLWRLSPAQGLVQLPRFIGCLIYPTYYARLVEQESATHELSPLFVYALLRQESLFEGPATSIAAAHGLMQVIPPTGAYIAESLAWPPDYQTRDLYRPLVSVRFGVWYLAEQMGLADGNPFVAMAAYNGGPGNALRWWRTAEGDTDLFAEVIDFHETRRYVRLIREHYAGYQWLYAGPWDPIVPGPTLRE